MNADPNWINDYTVDYLPAGSKLRPLRDQMFLKPLDLALTPAGSKIVALHRGKTIRGEVVAIGPGRNLRRWYKNAKGETHKVGELNHFIPTEVKVGDIVDIGGMEMGGYAFPVILIGLDPVIICQEADVTFVVEPDDGEAG
jgi:co-chaperonin GroES (HSP10)